MAQACRMQSPTRSTPHLPSEPPPAGPDQPPANPNPEEVILPMAVRHRPERSEVPEALTWDLAAIYPDEPAWEAAVAHVTDDLAQVATFRGRLGESGATLLGCLRARDALMRQLVKVGAYASLHASVDGASAVAQARAIRASALGARVRAEIAFIESELLDLADPVLAAAFAAAPELEAYRHQIDDVRRLRGHRLVPEAERAIAALGNALAAPGTVYHRAVAADLDFPAVQDAEGREVQTSVGRLEGLMQSPAREVRRQAHEALAAGLRRHRATFAATLAAMIERNVALARLRGYGSAEEMFLDPQRVSLHVYGNVLDVIHDAIAPHVRRLLRLRQARLDLPELRRYDLNAPLDPDYQPAATIEEGRELILTALRPLGEEYQAILADAFAHRWVDRADNVGKSHGAFCSTVYGVHSYVCMTWQDRMRDVFTLAHELGHAGHGMLAARNQLIGDTRPTRFFIEAPSTCHELLLGRHILAGTDDPRMRRWVIGQFLGTFLHNMVTHLLQGHLERRLYALAEAGRPLTLAAIMAAQGEVYERFYAGAVAVDDGMRLDWMTVPHYYTGLYPFTYAAGLACAHGVADAIAREGQPAVDRWLRTLKAGGTRPPLELMAMAGVDLSSPEPLRAAVGFFGEMVTQMEELFAAG